LLLCMIGLIASEVARFEGAGFKAALGAPRR
jgi:hypothetical protein